MVINVCPGWHICPSVKGDSILQSASPLPCLLSFLQSISPLSRLRERGWGRGKVEVDNRENICFAKSIPQMMMGSGCLEIMWAEYRRSDAGKSNSVVASRLFGPKSSHN